MVMTGAKRKPRTPEQARAKRARRAEREGRSVRSYVRSGVPDGTFAQDAREYRRQYKRAKRQAEPGYQARGQHSAHVAKWRKHLAAKPARVVLHDAHVRKWRPLHLRRLAYWANVEKGRAKARDKKARLVRSYVLSLLDATGIPREAIDEELINLKREQVMLQRLARQLRQAAASSARTHAAPLADVRRIIAASLLALARAEVGAAEVVAISKGVDAISSSLRIKISRARCGSDFRTVNNDLSGLTGQ